MVIDHVGSNPTEGTNMIMINSILVDEDNIDKVAHLEGPGGTIRNQWNHRTGTPMIGFFFCDEVPKPTREYCPHCNRPMPA